MRRLFAAAAAGLFLLSHTSASACTWQSDKGKLRTQNCSSDRKSAEEHSRFETDSDLGCFIAAGGTAAIYNLRCSGHREIGEAEAAERYLALSPARQVAADVAAEAVGSVPAASVGQAFTERRRP